MGTMMVWPNIFEQSGVATTECFLPNTISVLISLSQYPPPPCHAPSLPVDHSLFVNKVLFNQELTGTKHSHELLPSMAPGLCITALAWFGCRCTQDDRILTLEISQILTDHSRGLNIHTVSNPASLACSRATNDDIRRPIYFGRQV